MQNNYALAFAEAIFPIMQKRNDENICVVAMEFWSVFAREEHNFESNPHSIKSITGDLGKRLVETLLENLCFVEETDDEANGIS